MALTSDRVYYVQRANRQIGLQGFNDFHLLSVTLNQPAITDHGLIQDQNGRLVWRIPGLAANTQGQVFMIGDWWLNARETGTEVGTLRHVDGPGTNYTALNRGEFFAAADVNQSSTSNLVPSANAGPDQTITLPSSATLTGGVIDDGLPMPPGATLVSWNQMSGPAPVQFSDPNAASTLASFTVAGSYVIEFTADDGMWIGSDFLTINTTPANVPPTISVNAPLDGAVVTSPDNITLDASATDTDGTIAKVEFFDGAALLATVFTHPHFCLEQRPRRQSHAHRSSHRRPRRSHDFIAGQRYRECGAYGSLTLPAAGSVFTASASITLDASATDTDGTIAKVEFFDGAALLATVFSSPYTFIWNNAPVGSHTLTAQATDNLGAVTTSLPVNITVSLNQPPAQPILISPADGSTTVESSPFLSVQVSDPETSDLTVTFFGRDATVRPPRPDFTIVALPDTQFYVSLLYGGTPSMFTSQTDWIVTNRMASNIVFVTHLGDCVQNGDNGGNNIEWLRATNAMYRLENPLTTLLSEGIPYGVTVGNHDQTPPSGSATGPTTFYNQFFGSAHFAGRCTTAAITERITTITTNYSAPVAWISSC